jgi:FAD/FMN-containing dehydrogenase
VTTRIDLPIREPAMPTVNDVTQLNPIEVFAIATPRSTADLQAALSDTRLPVSVGGGHFSMGGQTASPGSLHLDLRQMNRVLAFDPQAKTIRVQAGIRWCDIQRFVDPHGLAVKIMQTYANFTVGGALSVNAHGRYLGLGPVVLSVRAITLVLADGTVESATPTHNTELFHAAIGGYGAIGIIAEAELELADNIRVERRQRKLRTRDYLDWFGAEVRGRPDAVFHNADLYPPHYTRARAVTWSATDRPATAPRLQPLRTGYLPELYVMWSVSETPFGKFRREFLIDPLLYARRKVHWRNYEAGYDAAELEPVGRGERTYVLQEYFVPHDRLPEFVPKMTAILRRHRVNAINISIRHAAGDPGTVLAWARGETFAFVLYYKQRTRDNARERVGVWTRELIDAVLACGGTYYLPYQLHATPEQFHRAYPRAEELFALKRRLDPDYRLRGALWDKYYQPTLDAAPPAQPATASLFHAVYRDTRSADRFYAFLQNIFHLYPEDRFHTLIMNLVARHGGDEAIYRGIQAGLPGIAPFLSELRYALPALAEQKREMGRQTARLLPSGRTFQDYVEIGTTGRYVNALRRSLPLHGAVTLVHDKAPTNSPVDIVERGQLRRFKQWAPLDDYAPIALPPASADLVSCFVGLHHMEPGKLPAFLASIARILRPGGWFVVRDHDVRDSAMDSFVALAHCVFNAGLGETWATNCAELRHFAPVDTWIARIEAAGFRHSGQRLVQDGDPSDNVLLAFERL